MQLKQTNSLLEYQIDSEQFTSRIMDIMRYKLVSGIFKGLNSELHINV